MLNLDWNSLNILDIDVSTIILYPCLNLLGIFGKSFPKHSLICRAHCNVCKKKVHQSPPC